MPIMNPNQDGQQAQVPVPIQVVDPVYHGASVDSRVIPVQSLLTYVEGSSWTVQYYQQVLGSDSEPIGLELTRSKADQQYTLVNRFELKVTQVLQSRQQDDTNQWETTGGANLYPGLIPNVGDMFLADIGDGREALFQVTKSEQKSWMSKTTYAIEYVLVNSNPSWVDNLNSKIVRETHFIRDYATRGSNPIIESADYHVIVSLTERYYDLIQEYFRSFYSREHGTILVPGQEFPIYDGYLMTALCGFFDTSVVHELINMRNININDDEAVYCDTIWRALMRREKRMIEFGAQRAGLVTRSHFRSQGMLEGIYYSRIAYVVYPLDPPETIDSGLDTCKTVIYTDYKLKEQPSRARTLEGLTPNCVLAGFPQIDAVLFKPVMIDDYYVLSADFYAKTANRSALEILVQDYLDGKELNKPWIHALAESYRAMGALERFYYGPIILILIKAALGSI